MQLRSCHSLSTPVSTGSELEGKGTETGRLCPGRSRLSGVERSVPGQTRSPLYLIWTKKVNRKSSLPLDVREPGGVPKSFGEGVAVYFQLGYLEGEEGVTQRGHF